MKKRIPLQTILEIIVYILVFMTIMHITNAEGQIPGSLVLHAHIAEFCFSTQVLISFLVWPIAFVLCLLIPRLKSCLFYLGTYAFSCLLCLGLLLLAPSRFLEWWWD